MYFVSISRALNTAEAAYECSLFSVLCLQLYILAETVCPRISLGAGCQLTGAPNEIIVQNLFNIALLNVF